MKVLIVARTRMSGTSRCIGGLSEDGNSVRLLTASGNNHSSSSPLQVGQTWELTYTPRSNLLAPHVEDVLVTKQRHVGTEAHLSRHLLRRVDPWEGGIDELFDGVLDYTTNDNGYICERRGVPSQSIGFWIPDRELVLRRDKKHYDYVDGFVKKGLSYVGEEPAEKRLPAGTLVRVSLARWWKPDDAEPDFEERCYLQLSGWY